MKDLADTKFFNFFLSKYNREDYVRLKSAQFTLLIGFLFASVIILMTIVAWFIFDHTRFIQLAAMTGPGILTSISIVYLIKKGKNQAAANILAIVCAIICSLGYLAKPIHITGVSMVYFMFVNIAFAALFCRAYISGGILITFLGLQIFNYIHNFPKITDPNIANISKTAVVDGPITLIIVFGTCLLVYRFLHKSLEKMEENSEAMKYNLVESNNLSNTLKQTALTLNSSMENHFVVLTNFSTNLNDQAASLEEITATVEEITSATDSVSDVTDGQYESLDKLLNDFSSLSVLIDNLNKNGQIISELFSSFMSLTSKSQDASSHLDETNKKIVANSNEILNVISIMSDFFDKINLLSLNASIEAARAGDSGRGFAVVADEIGKLADNSAQELKQVTALIDKNKSDADSGSNIINSIIGLIGDILKDSNSLQSAVVETISLIKQQENLKGNMSSKTTEVKEKSEIIKNAMAEQKNAITELMKSVNDTNMKVQENNEYYNELQNNADDLRKLAETLK